MSLESLQSVTTCFRSNLAALSTQRINSSASSSTKNYLGFIKNSFCLSNPQVNLNSAFLSQGWASDAVFQSFRLTDRKNRISPVTSMAWSGALASVRLIVQGKHMELTDNIKSYIEEKVGHAVQNHGALVREVDVRVSVRGGETGKGAKMQRTEVTVYTKKHGVVRAEEEAESMYASIDRVSDVLTRKLRKIKEKDGGHGRSWKMRHQPKLGELLPAEPVDLTPILNREPEDLADEVVRTKYFDMQPMDHYEALEQLTNLGHDFYAFRNAESGEINVIYKRRHGGFGMIVPRSETSWENNKEE